jgi:MurNAc alpha-1-phosphate uridylyltransferase
MIPPAMVFAAGFGTRMGALTRDRPKALVTVYGRALIDHALDRCVAAGVARAVVNLHFRGEQVRAHLAGRREPEIAFSEEAPDILDTGGGLKAALALLDADPVLTLNCDCLWSGPEPVPALLAAWDPVRMDGLLLLVPRTAATGHAGAGDFFLGTDGRLARRGTEPEAPFVYSGLGLLRTGPVAAMPGSVFSLNRVWDGLLAGGRLHGCVYRGGWADIGTPAGLARAEAGLP